MVAVTGAASTGSAFNATLITRTGPVMNIREWFATTDEQGAIAAGVVDPTEHKELFEEHGAKWPRCLQQRLKKVVSKKIILFIWYKGFILPVPENA